MAPRPLEPFDLFVRRLRDAVAAGAEEVRFGGHHWTHAACLDEAGWCVRKLELDESEVDAFMAEHGYFMPENAEDLSRPGRVVIPPLPLEQLIDAIGERPWPM